MTRSVSFLVRLAITTIVLVGLIGAPMTFTSDFHLAAGSAFARGGGGGSGSGGGCRHGLPSTTSSHGGQPSEATAHAAAPTVSTQSVAR